MSEKPRLFSQIRKDLSAAIDRTKGSIIVRIIELLTSVSVVAAVGGLVWNSATNYYSISDQQGAWEILNKYRGQKGEYGRKFALQILNAGCGSWVPRWMPFSPVCNDLSDVWIPHATLYNVSLPHAEMNRASFYNTFLDGANFEGASLREACFQKATLRNVNFRNADLRNADLRKVVIDEGTSFQGAKLCHTPFSQYYEKNHEFHKPGYEFDGDRDCPNYPLINFEKTVCENTNKLYGK